MWRILLALVMLTGIAGAQPVLTPWRPPVGCSTNQVIQFNGSAWVCGNISSFSTNNVIPKGNGTTLVASSWTDDGTTSTTTGDVVVVGNAKAATLTAGAAPLVSGNDFQVSSPTGATQPYASWFSSTVDPSSGGVGQWFNMPFDGPRGPVQITWSVNDTPTWVGPAIDFEGEDFILAYAEIPVADKYNTADLIRIGQSDRRFMFGPEVPRPTSTDGQFNFLVPPYSWVPAGIQLSNFTNADLPGETANENDFIRFNRNQDADKQWLAWHQGSGVSDWRVGMEKNSSGYNFNFYAANGASATPSSPGTLAFQILQNGNVYAAQNFNAFAGNGLAIQNSGGTFSLAVASSGNNTRIFPVGSGGSIQINNFANSQNNLVISNAGDVSVPSGAFTVNGNTTLGDTASSDTHTINGVTTVSGPSAGTALIVSGGTSSAATDPTGTTLRLQQASGNHHYLSMRGTENIGISFNTTSGATDGGIIYSASTDALRLIANLTVRQNITSGGQIQLGDTANTGVADNVDVVVVGNTGTGQTASTALLNLSHSGSFNASAAGRASIGALISITSTRSTGGNNVTNKGIAVSASGAQNNYAIETGNGDNRFNVDSGSSTFFGDVTVGSATNNSFTVVANTQRGIRNHYEDTYYEWNDEWEADYASLTTGAMLPNDWRLVISGSGPAPTATGVYAGDDRGGGAISLNTNSATNGSYVQVYRSLESIQPADGNYTFEATVKWDALSSSTNSIAAMYTAIVGFSDAMLAGNTINSGDGCFFAYDKGNQLTGNKNPSNLDRLECWCADDGARTGYLINSTGNSDNSFPLGDGTIAADTYYRLAIRMTGSSKAEFYKNGTKVCEITTNIFPGDGNTVSGNLRATEQMLLYSWATTGTGARSMIVDQSSKTLTLSSARSP